MKHTAQDSATTRPCPAIGHTSFHRTELLLGEAAFAAVQAAKVILFGVGGVGSWCAEALVRTGVRHLTMVDPDVVCPTNINRQAQATTLTVGRSKVEEMRKRLLEINPDADINAMPTMYDEQTCAQFDLAAYDYVLDAIDTLRSKVLLLERCLAAGVTVCSSMGAGAKLDPTSIRVATLDKTRHCPLARAVRKRLRQAGVSAAFPCVYSEEPPVPNRGRTFCGSVVCACPEGDQPNLCLGKARINGTLVQMTAPFGFALAGLVVQDVLRKASPESAA